jgi:hypothetical protein
MVDAAIKVISQTPYGSARIGTGAVYLNSRNQRRVATANHVTPEQVPVFLQAYNPQTGKALGAPQRAEVIQNKVGGQDLAVLKPLGEAFSDLGKPQEIASEKPKSGVSVEAGFRGGKLTVRDSQSGYLPLIPGYRPANVSFKGQSSARPVSSGTFEVMNRGGVNCGDSGAPALTKGGKIAGLVSAGNPEIVRIVDLTQPSTREQLLAA